MLLAIHSEISSRGISKDSVATTTATSVTDLLRTRCLRWEQKPLNTSSQAQCHTKVSPFFKQLSEWQIAAVSDSQTNLAESKPPEVAHSPLGRRGVDLDSVISRHEASPRFGTVMIVGHTLITSACVGVVAVGCLFSF